MTWMDKIKAAHTSVTNKVSHNIRLKSSRYFVWQEERELYLPAGNKHKEKAVEGTTDLFTKMEADPWKAEFEASLTAAGIAWYLNSIQFEEQTGYTHYEWVWTVTGSDA